MKRVNLDSPSVTPAKRKHRRAKRELPETLPNLVSDFRESGGKRKGKRMRVKPTETRQGYVTREMLQDAPKDANVEVDIRGRVHTLHYRREG